MSFLQRRRLDLLVLLLAWSAPLPAQQGSRAEYTLTAGSAATKDGLIPLTVELRLVRPRAARTVFEIPVWTPGSYRLREFPERIVPQKASAKTGAETKECRIERLTRSAFAIEHGSADEVLFAYRVELKPNDRFMDPVETRRCITFEGPAVWMHARQHLDLPCAVRFSIPEGWAVASGLEKGGDGLHRALDYDRLVDCPVKLGVFKSWSFQAHECQVEVVLDCAVDLELDADQWLAGLRAICSEAGAIFGGIPTPRYLFLYTASPSGGGGGLEHLNSTAIGLARQRFVRSPASSYGVSAHEFFHLWNVKRLRPLELGPFRYDRPNRTTGLWLSEGVTSYYAPLILARTGHTSGEEFWSSMAARIATWENTEGRAFTSLEEASLRVWDKQAPDRVVDYYGGGSVVGLLLDLTIRHGSGNQKSLDDVMLAWYRACEKLGRGLSSEEIERIASEASGTDLASFFDRHVRGTVSPEYGRILAHAGMKYEATRSAPHRSLRGADLSKPDLPVFRDLHSLEVSGGGDPLLLAGRIEKVDGTEVANSAAVASRIAELGSQGKPTALVEYRTVAGTTRIVSALLTETTRLTVSLKADPSAAGLELAIRGSLTKSRLQR